MDTLIEVSKLSKYELYRDLIKPVLNLCGKVDYVRGQSISVVNKDLCVSITGAPRVDFNLIPLQRIFNNKVKVGAIELSEYFAYNALNVCRAFDFQVYLWKGINYNYVTVVLDYDILTSNPKSYLSTCGSLHTIVKPEFEVYATLCRQQLGGRNTKLCQHQVTGGLVLVDLKKKYLRTEKELSNSFIKAMNNILKSTTNAVDSIYCITAFKPQGEFKNEVVYLKNENNEDVIVVYYGVEQV